MLLRSPEAHGQARTSVPTLPEMDGISISNEGGINAETPHPLPLSQSYKAAQVSIQY